MNIIKLIITIFGLVSEVLKYLRMKEEQRSAQERADEIKREVEAKIQEAIKVK